jgi:3',5'-cyclic AMP phosphodiesterase CpdA
MVCLALALAAACSGSSDSPTSPSPSATPTSNPPPGPPTSGPPPSTTPPPIPAPDNPGTGQTVTIVAVGDIGMCGSSGVEQAARVADSIDGQIVLAGDLAYMQGSMQDYLKCFDPFWGHFRRRWRPVPGNHEYETPGAAGYFQYFGEAAGPQGRSFYSFRAGDWLVLMLDSNIPVRQGSPQYEFARTELEASRATCTIAVFHHPLFSSGPNGPNVFMRDIWGLLYRLNADVVVAGHDHLYERFGKQDVDGRSDVRGLRQFIVGTGGARLYDFHRAEANSQVRIREFGVLRLTLQPTSYQWAFIQTGGVVTDSGTDGCH